MTNTTAAAADLRDGDVVRFRPVAARRNVTVRVSRVDEYGWVIGYRAKLEGDCTITRGELHAYMPPRDSQVELLKRVAS